MKPKLLTCLFFLVWVSCQEDDLSINILPSEKYKLDRRDVQNLKSDLERQLMHRVFEMQANWDQSSKSRESTMARLGPGGPFPTFIQSSVGQPRAPIYSGAQPDSGTKEKLRQIDEDLERKLNSIKDQLENKIQKTENDIKNLETEESKEGSADKDKKNFSFKTKEKFQENFSRFTARANVDSLSSIGSSEFEKKHQEYLTRPKMLKQDLFQNNEHDLPVAKEPKPEKFDRPTEKELAKLKKIQEKVKNINKSVDNFESQLHEINKEPHEASANLKKQNHLTKNGPISKHDLP